MVWEMISIGFWNFSLKTGTSSSTTTRFPCRSVLLMLIVMGLFAAAALLDGGFAAGVAERFAIGVAAGQGPGAGAAVVRHSRIDVALGGGAGVAFAPAVFRHSRIDVAGTAGAAAWLPSGAGLGVDLHSRIDVAGGVVLAGSSATSAGIDIAPSARTDRRLSILVLGMT